MRIKVNDVELDYWEEGYPFWFHITQGKKQISFTCGDAPAIRDALTSLCRHFETQHPGGK